MSCISKCQGNSKEKIINPYKMSVRKPEGETYLGDPQTERALLILIFV
jgi:hypothetical protein